ncbi:DUF3298 and DUF4163 domain-containing protein [Tamlana sp. 2201CG12-4]|uniref:DUF3298 and DUF4163 domain-containing protein n=1 Tax=Tamlana sp. 2201CG12-4 TaxID=3112582 RepID=UPI002DB94BF7|nr:DUF3298 and DUF4163 domain-containing protein [Tamlana sp. 2201CG12-4]MEC3906443.1 DUF3298 and DUF4163 domain-containing protein [Tamlana sp. 2201CG12-4]
MRLKNVLIFSCFLLIASGCKKEPSLSFSEIHISVPKNNIVDINIPKAQGHEKVSGQINAEIEKLVISALHIDDIDNPATSVKEGIKRFNTDYISFKTDFPESIQVWEAQIDGEILYQSDEIISISITSYVNTGGAHGSLHISFLNFEAESGHLIPNEKLFNNLMAFNKIAKPYFQKSVSDKDLALDINTFNLPKNISYNEDGVVLLYNAYEIAPYLSGITEFLIPFNEVESLLVFNSL